jgi:hypothetical protein
MNNEQKTLVAQSMKNLQEAVFDDSLCLMFQYEAELASLTDGEFSMGFLMDLMEANLGNGNFVIDTYLSRLLETTTGGEA